MRVRSWTSMLALLYWACGSPAEELPSDAASIDASRRPNADAAGSAGDGGIVMAGCGDGITESGELCLGPPFSVPAHDFGIRLVSADINDDGRADLVTLQQDGLCLFFNEGGTFPRCEEILIEGGQEVLASDLDGDGHIDLAVGRVYEVLILWGTSDGAFEIGPTISQDFTLRPSIFLVAGQFNADQLLDLGVAGDGPMILRNSGDRTFELGPANSWTPFFGQVESAAVGDLNEDNFADLLIPDLRTATGGQVHVFSGDGGGVFTIQDCGNCGVGGLTLSVSVADFDLDDHLDVATASEGNVSLLLGDGAGSFISNDSLPTFGGSTIVAADFSNDGVPDLAIASDDTVSILLGEGNGLFNASPDRSILPDGRNIVSLTVADFNEDGQPDLATLNLTTSNLSIFLSSP